MMLNPFTWAFWTRIRTMSGEDLDIEQGVIIPPEPESDDE
jgi:hypothetical protein